MTVAKTKPSPRRSPSVPPHDDLAALLTALHNEAHHPGEMCRLDGRGRCDAIAKEAP